MLMHMIKQRFISVLIVALYAFLPICAVSSPTEIIEALKLTPNELNGKKIFPLCASCHLRNGWGKQDGSFPVISGQHRKVLIKQLADIRAKNRQNPTMYPFTDPETIGGTQSIADVTAYISNLPNNPEPGVGNGQKLKQGEIIYKQQCMQCHGDRGQGNNDAFFPKLKGQHHAYLLRQLKWIRDGYRKNSSPAMVIEVKALNDSQLDAVADYLSRIK